MNINFSKGIAILGHLELSFDQMGTLERALNTAVAISDDAQETRAIAVLGEVFGVDLTFETVNNEISALGESLEDEEGLSDDIREGLDEEKFSHDQTGN